MILYVGLSIWTPMYSAIVVDRLWQSVKDGWESGIAFRITWDYMGRELLWLAIQYFFMWLYYFLQSYLMANVADTLVMNLRKQVAAKLNRLPLRFFDQSKAGEILSRVTSDLDKMSTLPCCSLRSCCSVRSSQKSFRRKAFAMKESTWKALETSPGLRRNTTTGAMSSGCTTTKRTAWRKSNSRRKKQELQISVWTFSPTASIR